ncbi:MAG: urease accessory protein UreD [bacterium]
MKNNPNPTNDAWQAELQLGFVQRQQKTVLAHRQRQGPLTVQRPFYPEQTVCHTYLLHPPGGIVGGDQLLIRINTETDTHALITAPGANKFYRSAGDWANQQQDFTVNNSTLEWLPQENIFFPAAKAKLHTHIQLSSQAKYIGWEINCLGRPTIDETFTQGQLEWLTHLQRDQTPLLIDHFKLTSQQLNNAASLRGHAVFATLLATPSTPTALANSQQHCADYNNTKAGFAGVSVMNDVLIVRYLGNSTAQAHRLFRQIWQTIRPDIIGKPAIPPRIWQT